MNCLTRTTNDLYHYKDGKRIEGANGEIRGDCSNLRGNCSGLYGDLDKITADDRKEFPEIEHWIEV